MRQEHKLLVIYAIFMIPILILCWLKTFPIYGFLFPLLMTILVIGLIWGAYELHMSIKKFSHQNDHDCRNYRKCKRIVNFDLWSE